MHLYSFITSVLGNKSACKTACASVFPFHIAGIIHTTLSSPSLLNFSLKDSV